MYIYIYIFKLRQAKITLMKSIWYHHVLFFQTFASSSKATGYYMTFFKSWVVLPTARRDSVLKITFTFLVCVFLHVQYGFVFACMWPQRAPLKATNWPLFQRAYPCWAEACLLNVKQNVVSPFLSTTLSLTHTNTHTHTCLFDLHVLHVFSNQLDPKCLCAWWSRAVRLWQKS